MVRKSSDYKNEAKLALATSAAARTAAAALLEQAGVQSEPAEPDLVVDALDYHLWLAVLVVVVENRGDDAPVEQALLSAFEVVVGDADDTKQATREAAEEALEAYRRVNGRIRAKRRELGRPVNVTPGAELDSFFSDLRKRGVRGRRPVPPDAVGIFEYALRRSKELAVSAQDVLAPQQGTRSERHGRVKDATALIVFELFERGAHLHEIGAIFGGRSKGSMHTLKERGRALSAEKGASDV